MRFEHCGQTSSFQVLINHNTIVVCSMEDSDGKSTIATNLAISFAQADRKTILVDADLRSPSIHKMVDVPRNPGLGDAFLNRLDVLDVIHYFKNNRKLMVIPAGSPPPDFIELLGTKKMGQVLTSLEEISDIVIIDGPPLFVPDSMMLSSKADGVLIVISAGRTRRGNIHTMTEQLNRVGTNIIGFVLNRVSINSGYYGNYYYYTAYYDTKDGGQKGKTKNVKSAGNQQK